MKTISRRIGAVTAVVAAVAVVLALQNLQAQQAVYTKDLFAMDTYFTLRACGPEGEEALKLCGDKVMQLEAELSVTREDSDICKLNAGESTVVKEDAFRLIEQALELCEETKGALDITLYPVLREWGFTTDTYRVPEEQKLHMLLENVGYQRVEMNAAENSVRLPEGVELDLGAVAKGYTGDCLLALLQKQGISSAMVDLGGNVQVLGSKPDGSPWRVAVRNPLDTGSPIGVLEITDKAVVTSGSYERYFEENGRRYWHILDSEDGYPADTGLLSVTVVGDSGIRCDGLSTALFVMGMDEAADFWRQAGDFEMLMVTEQGQLYITEGLQQSFASSEGWNAEVIRREP